MKKSTHWPTGLTIFYILFMLLTVAVVIFSSFHRIDLVAEDYYQQEMSYQRQIDRIQRTDSLSAPVRWIYDRLNKSLTLHFPPELKAYEVKGNLVFFRPSDAHQDWTIPLQLSIDNKQTLNISQLSPGFWKIKIFWETQQKEFYTEGNLVI
jgi:hypothetical protein